MASVRWTLNATQNFGSIVVRLGTYSLTYAAAFTARVIAATQRLEDFPLSGRVVPEGNEPGLRELIVGNYRVIYDVEDDAVVIDSVIDARRDYRGLT